MKVTYSIIIIVMAKEESNKWTVIELCVEKRIYQSSSSTLMYGLAATNAVSLLSCTHAVSACLSKLSLLSTPQNWVFNQFWLQRTSNNGFIQQMRFLFGYPQAR